MKTVSVYTKGNIHAASYYRILQYTNKMKDVVIKERFIVTDFIFEKYSNVNNKYLLLFWKIIFHICVFMRCMFFYISDAVNKPDCIIILRASMPKVCFFPLNKLAEKVFADCKLIWDFDDDIFEINEITNNEAAMLQKYSDIIIVTSQELKSKLNADAQKKVIFMPTTDGDLGLHNINEINKIREERFNKEIVLIWVASASGLKHMKKISKTLDLAAYRVKNELNKELVLEVVCNKPFTGEFKYLKVHNIVWSRDLAIERMANAHIGIMPLEYSKRALGKGGFKLIQYMAIGLPQIGSNIGYNSNVIIDGFNGKLVDDIKETSGWIEAILEIAGDFENWKIYSQNSLKLWNEKFSFENNFDTWLDLINKE